MNTMNISLDIITNLKSNEVFCFGSNKAGRHSLGAAKQALKWGAVYGKGYDHFGQTFAIPTKDKNLKVLSIDNIKIYVDNFIYYAQTNQQLNFLVTKIGCGLDHYTPQQIALLFKESIKYSNIYLPKCFIEVLIC